LTIRYMEVMAVIDSAGTLVRDARRRAGMTQAQLAHRAGITQSVVSAYEPNRREPSLPVLLRLIAATGHALEGRLVAVGQGTAATLSGPLGRRVSQLANQLRRRTSLGSIPLLMFAALRRCRPIPWEAARRWGPTGCARSGRRSEY
jgi:uncharacterized protein